MSCPRQDPCGATAPQPLCAHRRYGAYAVSDSARTHLIGCEVFGFGNLPMFFIACVVAYLFNMDKSIYALQERA